MRYRLLFIIGLLAGYVLGARAGRDRFEQIKDAASDALDSPAVKTVVDAAKAGAAAEDAPTAAPTVAPTAAPSAAPTPSPSPAPRPVPPVSGELPTVSTAEPLTSSVEDALDPALVDALEDLAEGKALGEDEARAHRDDD